MFYVAVFVHVDILLKCSDLNGWGWSSSWNTCCSGS